MALPKTFMLHVGGGLLTFTPLGFGAKKRRPAHGKGKAHTGMLGDEQEMAGYGDGHEISGMTGLPGYEDHVGTMSTGEAVALVGGGLMAVILVAVVLGTLPFAILFHYWQGWSWGKSFLVGFGAMGVLGAASHLLHGSPAAPALPSGASPGYNQPGVPPAGGVALPPPQPQAPVTTALAQNAVAAASPGPAAAAATAATTVPPPRTAQHQTWMPPVASSPAG